VNECTLESLKDRTFKITFRESQWLGYQRKILGEDVDERVSTVRRIHKSKSYSWSKGPKEINQLNESIVIYSLQLGKAPCPHENEVGNRKLRANLPGSGSWGGRPAVRAVSCTKFQAADRGKATGTD
jgi:hypothetical protein